MDILGIKQAAAKIIEHKECGIDIANEMLTAYNDGPDLHKKVKTGTESWVYGYDIETKVQSS